MLIQENPSLQSAAEVIFQINRNEQLRQICEQFKHGEIHKKARQNEIKSLKEEVALQKEELASKDATITALSQSNSELSAELTILFIIHRIIRFISSLPFR